MDCREISLLKELRHRNVIRVIDVYCKLEVAGKTGVMLWQVLRKGYVIYKHYSSNHTPNRDSNVKQQTINELLRRPEVPEKRKKSAAGSTEHASPPSAGESAAALSVGASRETNQSGAADVSQVTLVKWYLIEEFCACTLQNLLNLVPSGRLTSSRSKKYSSLSVILGQCLRILTEQMMSGILAT